MNDQREDMNRIEESIHDLRKLAALAEALRSGVESAQAKYETAVLRRMRELEQIQSELDAALSRTDTSADEYRKLCRSISERVAHLRGAR